MGKVSHAEKMRMQSCRRCVNRDAEQSNNLCVPVQRMEIKVIEDCKQLMPAGFIFQKDGAPAHTARVTQEWLHANCPEIIEKYRWPPNSPDLNPLDYYVWGGHAGKVSQTAAEAKDDRRAESRFAINMGRHATRADQQGRQGLYQTPEGMRAGQWWTL